MSIIAEARNAIGIRRDWLGEGGLPVDRRIAEHRAEICRQCPKNAYPKWWEYSKQAIAAAMRMHLEFKTGENISVDNESDLHMCRVCGCCLPLKIHVPLKHILANTPIEMLAAFPQNCWIPNESKVDA